MAYIEYLPTDAVPERHRVPDEDNIIRVHAVHSAVIRDHYALYRTLMHDDGPLSPRQREVIAVAVSSVNACHY